MIELGPATLAISGAIVASYTDLKSRIIPDKLTYPLILFGVVFHLVVGAVRSDAVLALSGLAGAALSFGIGYLLWLAGGGPGVT